MISFDFKEDCCGCGACASVCPVDAIVMRKDRNGFPFPHVNAEKCISCNLCTRTCPHLNEEMTRKEKQEDISTWLYASPDEKAKRRSSSGAAFYNLAMAILQQGGVVCGCAWDENLQGARHIAIDTIEELPRLQGSKYMQSIMDVSLYREIEKSLNDNQQVLFSGTPCQCEAVYHYVELKARKHLPNLLLVAVICHGVSAPEVWRTYKDWMEKKNGEKLISVNFRDKSREGYKKSYCRYQFETHTTYLPTYLPSSPYMEATIVYNLALRKSCAHCNCKGIRSSIDIIIGDWYAAYKGKGRMGTSCVVAETSKGIDFCCKYLHELEKIDFSEILHANSMIRDSSHISPQRDEFLKENSIKIWDRVEHFYPAKYKLKKILVKMHLYSLIKEIM